MKGGINGKLANGFLGMCSVHMDIYDWIPCMDLFDIDYELGSFQMPTEHSVSQLKLHMQNIDLWGTIPACYIKYNLIVRLCIT